MEAASFFSYDLVILMAFFTPAGVTKGHIEEREKDKKIK
jgi:hypothetical protein